MAIWIDTRLRRSEHPLLRRALLAAQVVLIGAVILAIRAGIVFPG